MYSTGSLIRSGLAVGTYGYTNSQWKDLLTAYNGSGSLTTRQATSLL